VSAYNLGFRRRAVRPSPVFLAALGVTALGGALAWPSAARTDHLADFGVFLFVLGGWVVSVCLHEFAHAYVAYRAGDHTVEAAGYLTLNPFKYTHPLLSIVLPLIFIIQGGIGFPGGAVYLHPHLFRTKAQRSMASAVGPLTNVVLAAVLLLIAQANETSPHPRFWCAVAFLGFLQVTAAVLNLLPIPGLDGWGIVEPYLAPETIRGAQPLKQWGMLGVFVLLQVPVINRIFFDTVYNLYELSGASRFLSEAGRYFFQFWAH
jgi:Zn-dependent protease